MVACDLGSNTFRVVEFDCRKKVRLKEYEKIVRLAEGLSESGKISKAALQRLLKAIEEANGIFDFPRRPHRCVATAAMRLAKNGLQIREEILKKTGLDFEIIDAKEEAELTRLAVQTRLRELGMRDDSCVLLDLGGGSTELTLCEGEIHIDQSLDIGIVTILEEESQNGLRRKIDEYYQPLAQFFNQSLQKIGSRPQYFVATAGTPTTIAAFLQGVDYNHYDYKKINGMVITREMLHKALERLLKMGEEERRRWVGVGREDLIIAGVLMLEKIIAICGYEEMIVIDDGLREGVALKACGENLAK
ncbi:MAG: hypothetical protein B6D59_03135 [Campylobacteraceae bacterium 4484_4]|nr:MAG: hypothetical protein B6D59_03135 [Campylobacteraceae bacterium 4484_4]